MASDIQAVYKVLDYALTKAAVSAKLTNSTIRVSYRDLLKSIGQETDKEYDLVIKISMEWDESPTLEAKEE